VTRSEVVHAGPCSACPCGHVCRVQQGAPAFSCPTISCPAEIADRHLVASALQDCWRQRAVPLTAARVPPEAAMLQVEAAVPVATAPAGVLLLLL
jgi:hypothetical protein